MANVTAHLTPEEGQYCQAVEEFFSVARSRRSKTTYKDTLTHFTAGGLEVWITLHQLSLWQDKDYVGKQYLRRGHIVEKHYIKLPDGTIVCHYQDYGAHPKFANLDQHGFPDAQRDRLEAMTGHGEVNLFVKESGSMNIAVFPPQHFFIYPDPDGKVSDEVLYRQDNCWTTTVGGWHVSSMFQDDGDNVYNAKPMYSYNHPMTHYVTSKNGWDNEYARVGEAVMKRCLEKRGESIDSLRRHLHNHERSTVVFELMCFQEHVYADTKEELYVHMVDNCLTSELGVFLTSYLPTVELVGRFDSVKQALTRWERDNDQCNHELEGYVLVVSLPYMQELKVKLKFWKYLALREFREALKRKCCPSREELVNKYKLWDMPHTKWAWYMDRTREWFWWVKSPFCSDEDKAKLSAGEYIAIRGRFLIEDEHNIRDLLKFVSEREPVMIYFVLTGVQCIGKSRFRKKLHKQYPGFVRSQDECGGNRANLIKEISKWAESCEQPGMYSTIIDRCNLNWDQRRTLFNDLDKVPRTGYVYTINISHTNMSYTDLIEMLFTRFLTRENHPSFSTKTVGAIKGLEILRDSLASYSHSPDGVIIQHNKTQVPLIDNDIPVDNIVPVEYNKYGRCRAKQNKNKFVYGGIVVLGALENARSQWARCFDGPADYSANWHGTHVTLVYGKGKEPLPEGEPVEITVFGRYRSTNICGLLVGIPGYGTLKHITLTTRNDATPGQSNAVIEQLFGGSPDCGDLGREIPGVEWVVVPYKMKGWYGNYYN